MYGYLWGKTTALRCIPLAINGMPDHIHLAISIPPTQSISKIVGHLKGSSSRYINRELEPKGSFAWQTSYGVLKVSESGMSKLIRYIDAQKQHHADETTNHGLEKAM